MSSTSPQALGGGFHTVEEDLQYSFLPTILRGATDKVLDRGVTRIAVKQAGIALPNPTISASENWKASCVIT